MFRYLYGVFIGDIFVVLLRLKRIRTVLFLIKSFYVHNEGLKNLNEMNGKFLDFSEYQNRSLLNMTFGEFMSLQEKVNSKLKENAISPQTETKKWVYGYNGIAELFGCSKSTAARIKLSGDIDGAITQVGRKIIVDAELAIQLARKKKGGRN